MMWFRAQKTCRRKRGWSGRWRGSDVDHEWDGSENEHEQDVVERTGVVWAKSRL